MAWILQILPFLVFLFVVVSVIRNVAKVARKLGEPRSDQASPANYDPAAAERTRRIQEEIRRKIVERRGLVISPAPEPPSIFEEAPPLMAEEPAPEPSALATASATAAVLERQEQLAEQMRALEEARLHEQRRAAAVAVVAEEERERAAAVVATREAFLSELRNPTNARRAILLREILDRPVAFR